MARRGKIARLPKGIREELNKRLQNGEEGEPIVAWLNSLPEVQKAVAEDFGGFAITEQNLSEWRKGGFRDWEAREWVQDLKARAEDLEAAGVAEVSQRWATVVAVDAARAAETMLEEVDNAEAVKRWQRLREVLAAVAQLRHADRKTAWLTLELNRRELEQTERLKTQWKKKLTDPIWARLNVQARADTFGGGKAGRALAAFMEEVERELPAGSLGHGVHGEKKGNDGGNPIEEHLKRQMRIMQEKGLKLEDMAGG